MKGKKITSLLLIALFILTTITLAIPFANAAYDMPERAYELEDAYWEYGPDYPYTRGQYSALFDDPYEAYVKVWPDTAITLDTFDPTDIAFDYWIESGGSAKIPELELRFISPNCIDPDGAGHFDITLDYTGIGDGEDAWYTKTVDGTDTAFVYGNFPPGHDDEGETFGRPSTWVTHEYTELDGTLSDVIDFLLEDEDFGYGDWELYRVSPQIWDGDGYTWVDNVKVGTKTYDLEPIVLDADYYHIGSTVIVTLFDPDMNENPVRTEIYDWYYDQPVYVESYGTSDEFYITVTETGVNTGIFVGTFDLVAEDPAQFELIVESDDTIYVENYWNWPYYGVEAVVDDLGPSVTNLYPAADELISTNTTDVRAYVSDTNLKLAWMTVDGITRDSTTEDDTLLYTFGTFNALEAGLHTAEVHAEDIAGNFNVTTWSFTVDVVDPTCEISMNATSPVKAGDIEFYAEFSEDMQNTTAIDYTCNVTEVALGTEKWTANAVSTVYATISVSYNGTALIEVDDALDIAGNEMVPASFTFYIDTVDPTAPDNLIATPGATSVVLDWDASDDFGSGMALYNIYDGTELIGTVDYPMATYTHIGLNDVVSLSYIVEAVDLAGNKMNSSALAVSFTPGEITEWEISLEEGWNLVSLPLIPDDSSTEVVLADILVDVESVWSYDEATGGWQSYAPGAPSDLSNMVDGDGYWVKMSSVATLTIHGDVMPEPPAMPPTYDLYAGWNLIGFKSLVPMEAQLYLGASLAEDCIRIYGFDNGAYFGVAMDANLVPGLGYWIAMAEAGTIYP